MVSYNIEKELDSVVRNAESALTDLATETIEPIRSENVHPSNRMEDRMVNVPLDIEFGRTSVPQGDASRLNIGSIIPLPNNPNGHVQIVWDKKTIAEGTLMILEGKLAIRISEVED